LRRNKKNEIVVLVALEKLQKEKLGTKKIAKARNIVYELFIECRKKPRMKK